MAIWDDVIPAAERAEYEKAGWGGNVGFGERPALIVVDMYRAFVDPDYPFAAPDAVATAERIEPLLAAFREAGRPVFHSRARRETLPAARGRWKARANEESPLLREPEAYEFWPSLAPREDEHVIEKAYPSAFFGTTLVSRLVYYGIDTLVVCGTVTSGCVRGTCLDAFNLNYRVIVPEECVCDRGTVSHKVALFEIHMKYGDVVPSAQVLESVAAV